MLIDFSLIRNKEMKMLEYSERFNINDLRAATNAYLDAILDIIGTANDAQFVHNPIDPNADDPYAIEGEENIGWNLAHLALHVTATLEEGAAFSSILARGIAIGGRLRSEPYWKIVTTRAQVLERIEESRRMCLAYLDTWPNQPHLDTFREVPPQYLERVGQVNAPAAYLNSLMHFDNHLDQFRDVVEQARNAVNVG